MYLRDAGGGSRYTVVLALSGLNALADDTKWESVCDGYPWQRRKEQQRTKRNDSKLGAVRKQLIGECGSQNEKVGELLASPPHLHFISHIAVG